ncbi:hypothetical protein WNY37_14855 [Henriciella sp. AS95]|uniref:hypothetical protein n=1 Tax=Henriciella sp. AS95 TaxID=3135782 RepID=UPI003172A42C
MRLKQALIASLLMCAGGAYAQEDDATEASKPSPCSSEPYRAFDFWLGEWTVKDPVDVLAGTNVITSEENGCLIVERWTGAEGSTGQSYNYFNPVSGMWRQVWVSPGAMIDYEGGINQRGQMVLEGEISYRNGDKFPFRGEWTPNDDGSVRQHFEQYNPDTNEWDDWFVGIYRK